MTDGTVSLTASWANGMGGGTKHPERQAHAFVTCCGVSPSMGAERQRGSHECPTHYRARWPGHGFWRRISSTDSGFTLMSKHA